MTAAAATYFVQFIAALVIGGCLAWAAAKVVVRVRWARRCRADADARWKAYLRRRFEQDQADASRVGGVR